MELDAAVELAERINAHRVHAITNTYTSPQAACEAWMRGSLWGNPIYLKGQVQVYGCWLRNWSQVYVWFRRDVIVVVKPPKR